MAERITTKHDIQKDEINTSRPGFSAVQRIFVAGSISIQQSTGVDSGTGEVTLNSVVTELPKSITFSGVIPATISSNQNDWNPTDLANASAIQINATTAVNITGLVGGVDGRIITLFRVGTGVITLKYDDGASSADNRFVFPHSGDFIFEAAWQSITLQYQSSRWRPFHSLFVPGNSSPAALGVATSGSSQQFSRQDHVHPETLSDPSIAGQLAFQVSTLTIASGVITVTRSNHAVDTEGAAATDDLDTINGFVNGAILILRASSSARTIVVKNGTGNINLAGSDFSLDNVLDRIVLMGTTTGWVELARANNGA